MKTLALRMKALTVQKGGNLRKYVEGKYLMSQPGAYPLAASLICFVIYFGNVTAGAAGIGVFLGDVAEMLMLFVTTVLFVVGVLAREASAQNGES